MRPNMPVLFVLSGLPGSGKTTLAKGLSQYFCASYIRIDTIEHSLKPLFSGEIGKRGYLLGHALAYDNLMLGHHVVSDSCNPVSESRLGWGSVAADAGAVCVNIEIVCSDVAVRQQRVENRYLGQRDDLYPCWDVVKNGHYERWTTDRLVVDTAGVSPEESLAELLGKVSEFRTYEHQC